VSNQLISHSKAPHVFWVALGDIVVGDIVTLTNHNVTMAFLLSLF